LGGFAGRLPGGGELRLPTRKSEALLAYLAMSPGVPVARETLAELLWGGRGEEQARNSLRQALAVLRKALAPADPSPLYSDRRAALCDADAIWLDVAEFERLVAAETGESLASAAALYRGEFLAGLHFREPSIDEWVSHERRRLQAMASRALAALLDCQRRNGDEVRAIGTAQRLLALDPLAEATHCALMELHLEQGQPGLAIRQYGLCREILAEELGVEPGDATEELYRSACRSRTIAPGDGKDRNHPKPAAAARPALPEKPSIVVLPFDNTGNDPEEEYFSDGITEDIITDLSRYSSLFVTARTSSFAFKGRDAGDREIARNLAVSYVVGGSVRRAGDRLRVTVRLVEAESGTPLWGQRYDRKTVDLVAIQDEIAETVAATLAGRIGEFTAQRARRKAPENLTAVDCMLQARRLIYRFNPKDNGRARELLDKAIAIDPDYATAHAWLAESWWCDWAGGWRLPDATCLLRMSEAAERAYRLDDADAQARLEIGQVHLFRRQYDEARHHIWKAAMLNPGNTDVSVFQSMYQTFTGDAAGAVDTLDAAMRRDPFGHFGLVLGMAQYSVRRYEEACAALKTVRARFSELHAWRAASEAQRGDTQAARAAATRFREAVDADRREAGAAAPVDLLAFLADRNPFAREQDAAHFLDGLAKAGLDAE